MSARRPTSLDNVDFDVIGEPSNSTRRRDTPGRKAPLAKIESLYDDIEAWSLLPSEDQTKNHNESVHEQLQRSLFNEKLSLIRQFEHSSDAFNDVTETNSKPSNADNGKVTSSRATGLRETVNGGNVSHTLMQSELKWKQALVIDENLPLEVSPVSRESDGLDVKPLLPVAVASVTSAPVELKVTLSGNQSAANNSANENNGFTPTTSSATTPSSVDGTQFQPKQPAMDEKTRSRYDKLQRELMDAVDNKKPSKIKKLLKSRHATMTAIELAKLKPFHTAINRGNIELVQAFVEADPGLVKQPEPETGAVALHAAVAAGRAATVHWLVDHGGARLDTRNVRNKEGIWDLTRRLPTGTSGDSGGRIGGRTMAVTLVGLYKKHRKDYATTPIHEASAVGDISMMEYLIGIGLDLWADDQAGYNFVHIAAFNDKPAVIRRFFEVEMRNYEIEKSSGPSSHITSETNSAGGIEKKNKFTGKTALHVAANRGHVSSVDVLLMCGARPTTVDSSGWTALHDAAASRSDESSPDVVRTLVRHSPDLVRLKNDDSETPLHVAARHGRLSNVKTLIEFDPAPLTTVDRDGWTPLHGAVSSLRPDVVQAILDAAIVAFGQDGAKRLLAASDKSERLPKQLIPEKQEKTGELLRVINSFSN